MTAPDGVGRAAPAPSGPRRRPALDLLAVHHVAVICTDYAASKRFYVDVLGLTLRSELYRAERRSWMAKLELDGTYVVELFTFPDPPARRTHPEATGLRHLAFEVEDVHAAAAALHVAGVPTEPIRTDPTTGKAMTFFFDPDGQPLELYQH